MLIFCIQVGFDRKNKMMSGRRDVGTFRPIAEGVRFSKIL